MIDQPDLARLARTIGDSTRMRMLTLLMEGRVLTAKELAYGSGVEPATASSHLRRLESDGLVGVTAQGRHKYFRLASADVARAVESLMVVAAPLPANASKRPPAALSAARFCYDHLAGRLGTALLDMLVTKGYLILEPNSVSITPAGAVWFTDFGLDLDALSSGRRRLAFCCLDWSERRDHLAGALGAAIALRFVELGWIVRRRDSRAVTITETGKHELATLSVDLPDLAGIFV